jgi:ring-1,2-phenylacetyl-CoA epoxidase subunit PaaE
MLKFHALRVAELHPDAEDAVAVALDVPEELRSQFAGLPGQHIVLRTRLDGEEARRTYSLINSPGEWPLRIVARVHSNGRMSRHLADQVKIGDSIDVLPPNGSLTSRTRSDASPGRTYVGFASGCGITPILSIIKAVLRSNSTDRFILFYGNSGVGRAMCLEELLGLKDRYMDRLALHFVMSQEPQEVELYNGRVDGARVRGLAGTFFKPELVEEYFVCGPGDMIQQVTHALRELSVGADRIHAEHFRVAMEAGANGVGDGATAAQAVGRAGATGAARATVGTPADAAGSVGAAAVADTANDAHPAAGIVDVSVLMDGRRRTFKMRMDDETVLDGATRAGLDLPFSCRAGVCSTCRTKVISGEVEMAQNYALEEWELEQGYVLACQAHVKTPTLELDYDEK